MALVLHLPLNGNLKDYSSNDIEVTNENNIPILPNGKIGKTYGFNGSDHMKINNVKDLWRRLSKSGNFGLSCWICPDEQNMHVPILGTHFGRGVALYIRGGETPGNHVCINRFNYETGERNFLIGGALNFTNWNHIFAVCENGEFKLYLNRQLVAHGTSIGSPADPEDDYYCDHVRIGDLLNWGPVYSGKINDIRIYDHAPNKKEVNDVYLTKILHYTFNQDFENRENFASKLTGLRSHTSNSYDVEQISPSHSIIKNIDGSLTTASWGYNHLVCDSIPFPEGYYSGKVWVKVHNSNPNAQLNRVRIRHYFGSIGENSIQSTGSEIAVSKLKPGWNELPSGPVINVTAAHTAGFQRAGISLLKYSAPEVIDLSGVEIEVKVCIEKVADIRHGEHYEDISSNILYDESGYGNDVVIPYDSSPRWYNDGSSRKGSGRAVFNDVDGGKMTGQCIEVPFNPITGSFSVAFWHDVYNRTLPTNEVDKPIINQTESNSYERGFGIWYGWSTYNDLRFSIGDNDGDTPTYYIRPASEVSEGVRSHIICVYDMENLKVRVYKSGKLLIEQDQTSGVPLMAYDNLVDTTLRIGKSIRQNSYYIGGIDDIKMYATALNDDDAMRIYRETASVDDQGIFRCNEVDEIRPDYYNAGGDNKLNLVRNGNLQLGNGENFTTSQVSYDSVEEALAITGRYVTGYLGSEYIPIDYMDRDAILDVSFTVRGKQPTMPITPVPKMYLGLVCFDENHAIIWHHYANSIDGTNTKLTANINNGDTVIHLEDASKFLPSVDSYGRHLAIYGAWSDHPKYEYTRCVAKISSVDVSNNTITLTAPWANSSVLAGTPVNCTYDGGGYEYICASDAAIPDSYKTYSAKYGKAAGRIRSGTKYVRPLILANRHSVEGSEYFTYIKSIEVYADRGSKIQNSAIDKYGASEFNLKENSVLNNEISELGVTNGLIGYWDFRSGDLRDLSFQDINHDAIKSRKSVEEPPVVFSKGGITTKSGNCVLFDNTGAIGPDPDYHYDKPEKESSPFTYETYFRYEHGALVGDGQPIDPIILGRDSYRTAIACRVSDPNHVYGRIQFRKRSDDSFYTIQANHYLPGDGDYHVIMTYDCKKLKLYVDGELVSDDDVPEHALYKMFDRGDTEVSIGSRTDRRYDFNGTTYFTKIYNKALTAKEVKLNYRSSVKKVLSNADNVVYADEFVEGN